MKLEILWTKPIEAAKFQNLQLDNVNEWPAAFSYKQQQLPSSRVTHQTINYPQTVTSSNKKKKHKLSTLSTQSSQKSLPKIQTNFIITLKS